MEMKGITNCCCTCVQLCAMELQELKVSAVSKSVLRLMCLINTHFLWTH